jgi:hypothetical protein
MKELVFAFNEIQYTTWRNDPNRNDSAIVVTADLIVADLLHGEGRSFLEVWEFLEATDIDCTQSITKGLVKDWWKPFFNIPDYRGVNLCDAFSKDMWYAFSAAINGFLAFERIIEREKPDCVAIFKDFQKETFLDPIEGPYPDVANAVAYWCAEKRQIPVKSLFQKFVSPSVSPESQRSGLSLLPEREVGKPTILNWVAPSALGRRIAIFAEALENSSYQHIVCGTGTSPIYEKYANVVDSGIFWSELPKSSPLHAQLETAWKYFKSWQSSYTGNHPYLFCNSHLDFQFRAFLDRMREGVDYINGSFSIFTSLQPNLLISEFDGDGFGNCRSRVAKLRGIPTLTFSHGSIFHSAYDFDLLTSEADVMVVEGECNKKGFERSRQNLRVEQVGPFWQNSVRTVPAQKVLLLTGLGAYGLSFPSHNLHILRQSFYDLADFIRMRPDLQFILKPHPNYDYLPFYKKIFASLPNLEIQENVALKDVLCSASIAVMIGGPSSAAIEAICAEVPFLYLKNSAFRTLHLTSNIDCDELRSAYSIDELGKNIDLLLKNSTFRDETLSKQKKFLGNFFIVNDSSQSIENLRAIVERLLSKNPAPQIFPFYQRTLFNFTRLLEPLVNSRNRLLFEVWKTGASDLGSPHMWSWPYCVCDIYIYEARMALYERKPRAFFSALKFAFFIAPCRTFLRLFGIFSRRIFHAMLRKRSAAVRNDDVLSSRH